MDRRTFLELLGAGGAAALVSCSSGGCTTKVLESLRPWEGPLDPAGERDIRLRLAAWALLAPSAHIKQPWVVDLRGEGIALHVDPRRLLPETDPESRQIMVSQGTFLEVLSIAATHEGVRAVIELFPEGVASSGDIGERPVAHVSLVEEKDLPEDRLFPFIRRRHTNRRRYGGPALTDEEVDRLAAAVRTGGIRFRCLRQPAEVSRAAALMTEAMRTEATTPRMHAETVGMLRFDDAESERHRDGIALPNLGLTGLRLVAARAFVNRRNASGAAFVKRTVDVTREQASSAPALGVLSSASTTRADEVEVGRAFARLHLEATALGLALHPMSQVLEIEEQKTRFVQEVLASSTDEPQMVFRLGRATATPHSPRRALATCVRPGNGAAALTAHWRTSSI